MSTRGSPVSRIFTRFRAAIGSRAPVFILFSRCRYPVRERCVLLVPFLILYVVHFIDGAGAVGVSADLLATKDMGDKVFPLESRHVGRYDIVVYVRQQF